MEVIRRPREETTPEEVKWAIELYRRIGALDFAQAEARRLIDGAWEVIDRIPMEESHRQSFREISRFMIDRST